MRALQAPSLEQTKYMSYEFYDRLLETSGLIAEEYGIAISDAMGLLQLAGRDEALVRQALTRSSDSEEAKAAQRDSRLFDLAGHARLLLQHARTE